MQNTLSIIFLLGVIQGIILSVVLFKSKFNRLSNKVLAGAILTVSLALLLAYFQVILDYKEYPFHIKSILVLPLIFVPLIFLYTKLNTKENKILVTTDIKYFIPFFVFFIYNLRFYFGPITEKIAYFERENITNSAYFIDELEIVIINLIVFLYAVFIFKSVMHMRKNYEREVSNYQENIIQLMFFLAIAVLVFTLTGLILSLFQIVDIPYPTILDFLTAIGSSFLIYFIGYYTLLHPQIFHPLNKTSKKIIEKPVIVENKERLNDAFFEKILKAMVEDKLYKDPELTLQSFAEHLKIPSYLVSKLINIKTEMNFYNFVNKYRIEEVKHQLITTNSPQIMQIAFDAGFNTKSSFYNYFKKHTGTSPKDFLK